jgi:hypothetical protein
MQLRTKETAFSKVKATTFGHKIKKIVKHPLYEGVISTFVALNLLFIFGIDWMDIYGADLEIIYTLIYSQIGINFFF